MILDDLVIRVRGLQRRRPGSRILIGIAGEPGSGKSTLAAALAVALGAAVVVPMDGFHLANAELERLGRADRKGALDTFDAAGYAALLGRLRGEDGLVYAPRYVRGLEEGIAGSIPVPRELPVVISEGNYLLVDAPPWAQARSFFDEVWFVEAPQGARLERLVERHVAFGKSREAAEAWAHGPDEVNARLIRATRGAADLIIDDAALLGCAAR